MKIVKYELSLVQKKELILTMEDNVDSENLLKIFLETQVKEEKEQDGLIGIIAEKVSEESYVKHPNANKRWTRRADQFLLELHNEGKSVKYIAAKMGRSQTSIVMRLNKLTQ